MHDLESLTNRVRVLESRARRQRIFSLIACILVASFAVMAQGPGRPGDVLPNGRLRIETQATRPEVAVETEIRSQHLVLVDDSGRERASLAADSSGSVFLVMFDAAGKPRVNLSLMPQGPSLVFSDPTGQARTILGSTSSVASRISENGTVERSPTSSIILFDRNGRLLHRTP